MTLLTMMTCLTREEPVPGHRAASGAFRTLQQLTKANGPRQPYAGPPTVRWTPWNCAWLVGWNLTPFG